MRFARKNVQIKKKKIKQANKNRKKRKKVFSMLGLQSKYGISK